MKPALHNNNFAQPIEWSDLPQGDWLRNQTEYHLNEWLPRVFGYYMVKIGALSAELDCSLSPIKQQVNLAEFGHNIGVRADLHHLPFRENSVDAVVMAHNLNFTHDPHQLLREAHRILIPDGYLILTSFNPVSLCGLGQYMPKHKNKLPWSGRFFTAQRVVDWLEVLGCEVVAKQHYIQRSLLTDKKVLTHYRMLNFCEQYLSKFSTCYMIVARKRELPLTPIRPQWKVKTKFQPVGTMRM